MIKGSLYCLQSKIGNTLNITEISLTPTKSFLSQSQNEIRDMSLNYNGDLGAGTRIISSFDDQIDINFANNIFLIDQRGNILFNNIHIQFGNTDKAHIATIGNFYLNGEINSNKINFHLSTLQIKGNYKKTTKTINSQYIIRENFSYRSGTRKVKGSITREYKITPPQGPSCCNYPKHQKTIYSITFDTLSEEEMGFLMILLYRLL